VITLISEVARDAQVVAVVLAHLGASVIDSEESVRTSMRSAFAGDVRFASDCMRFATKR